MIPSLSGLPLTYLIIGLNVILYFITLEKPDLLNRMLFINKRILVHKEYDRLITSGFIHGSFLHLLFNMLTLYYFGPYLEMEAFWPGGRILLLVTFLSGILGGNLYCLFMKKEQGDYAALGASGGVVGIVYSVIFLHPDIGLSMFFIPISIPGWLFAIIFSIGSIVLSQVRMEEGPSISHEGHLGGALFSSLIIISFFGAVQLAEQWYFIFGALLPIVLLGVIKAIKPDLLYRHH